MFGIARSLRTTWLYVRPLLLSRLSERGQTLLEYLILAGVTAIVVIAGVAMYADEIMDFFSSAGTWVEGGAAPVGPSYPSGTAAPGPD